MFEMKRFGACLSRYRKELDLTQEELANRLNLTRQTISKYELGESFPEVTTLIEMAKVFGISMDEMIQSGIPEKGMSDAGTQAAGMRSVPLAPYVKPSVLGKLCRGLAAQGMDMNSLLELVQYLSDETLQKTLQELSPGMMTEAFVARIASFLDHSSRMTIVEKVLEGEADWRILRGLLPYETGLISLIEAAVLEGALPKQALELMNE